MKRDLFAALLGVTGIDFVFIEKTFLLIADIACSLERNPALVGGNPRPCTAEIAPLQDSGSRNQWDIAGTLGNARFEL